MTKILNMTNGNIANNQWLFIDESGKSEVYSTTGKNLIENNQVVFATKNTSLGAIRCNYPFREVRTSHVSLNGLL